MLLTLSLTLSIFATKANAYEVTSSPSTTPTIIHWENYTAYQTLKWNPEYLMLKTLNPIHTNMTVIIQGKDTNGQPIEARADLPGTKDNTPIGNEYWAIFNDTHTNPPKPVAFAEITGILQQNGTDNDGFMIYTLPVRDINGRTDVDFEQYMGQYHVDAGGFGWKPGVYEHDTPSGPWLVTQGQGIAYTVQDVPVEPANPDPMKIVVNWIDSQGPSLNRQIDLYPQADEINGVASTGTFTLYIEGLDENGNKIIKSVDVNQTNAGAGKILPVDCTYTWSTICKVWGGSSQDSYYIFTHPTPKQLLFKYYVIIDHVTLNPDSYDILAYPGIIDGVYPGVTNVTMALRDIDGNIVHAADADTYLPGTAGNKYIVVNFYTSGGKIQPSSVRMQPCNYTAIANLTADTNARTITVTVDINVPPCAHLHDYDGTSYHGEMNLFAWTNMTFDGINSYNSYKWPDWPIYTLHWGFNTTYDGNHGPFDAPPKPWIQSDGGPASGAIKLDGPIYEVSIPLFVGCNLISSPVHPLMSGTYYNGYPETAPTGDTTYNTGVVNEGIPMNLLFNYTSATQTIEAIWWYTADGKQADPYINSDNWHVYIPGVTDDPDAYFTDGIGYWIKAEKPCTLEISGIFMENGPFTPPTYKLRANTWNLIGVTSVTGIKLADYLESTRATSQTFIDATGPVYEYINPGLNAQGTSVYPSWFPVNWIRDPEWVWPGRALWVYNKVPSDLYLAP